MEIVWTKQCNCENFIPDEHDKCDWCLLVDYKLIDKRRLDSSDTIGLGPYYIEEEAVIKALHQAEGNSATTNTQASFDFNSEAEL